MQLQGKTVMKGYKRENNEETAVVDEKSGKKEWKGKNMLEQVEGTICRNKWERKMWRNNRKKYV